jgi:hypothetical protein
MSRAYASRAAVQADLQPGEKVIYIFRHHAVVLTAPVANILGALVAGTGASIVTANKYAICIVWLISGLLICTQFLSFISWCTDFFVVTSKRLILSTSPVANETKTIDISWKLSVDLQSSWRGYLFGYGSIVIKSPGNGEYNVNYVKYPRRIYYDLSELIQNASTDTVDNLTAIRAEDEHHRSNAPQPSAALRIMANIINLALRLTRLSYLRRIRRP